jgi:two-component system, OmpR family, KDP operon response regulator KdpE
MTQPAAKSILIIDDERPIRRLLRATLECEGYKVREAENGILGIQELTAAAPDGVILDLGLPDIGGSEVLKRLRSWSSVPVLILSVRDDDDEKIAALDDGADDYLTKPFNGGILLARVRAILRRAQTTSEPPIVRFGDIEFDRSARIVRRAGVEVHLTSREYALLALLVHYRGKVITHRQILREIWGPGAEERFQYLRVHMGNLRQKLEENPGRPRHLKTDSGIGYRLVE